MQKYVKRVVDKLQWQLLHLMSLTLEEEEQET